MTDTLVLVWKGTSFTSSSTSSTGSSYHLVGSNISVDWGDGTTGTITSGYRFTHTYNYDGTYTIVITGNITRLGAYCFRNCTGLKKIIIPSSVTTLNMYALNGCSKLQQLVFTRDTPPLASSNTFNNIPTTCKIYIPNSAYKSESNYPSSSTYTYIEQDTTTMAEATIITSKIFRRLHPTGTIYMTVEGTNPDEKFGGAWQRIKDTFILGCGSQYSPRTTGGTATHTLSTNELPTHRHSRLTHPQGWAENNLNGYEILTRKQYSGATAAVVKAYEGYTGGGAAHNNMPPYFVVNMWRRLA